MKVGTILIVDDELSMRQYLSILLKKEGYDVQTAENGEEAIQLLKKHSFSVILTDYNMPEAIDGMHLLAEFRRSAPQSKLIVITAYASTEIAMNALELGATDYVSKPFTMAEIRSIVQRANEAYMRQQEQRNHSVTTARPASVATISSSGIVAKSKAMQEVIAFVEKIAASDSTVLITGESGVGKEVVARYIHQRSTRKKEQWYPVNCGAIPPTLLESELFGHEKGAFTGADSQKKGFFEVASDGTLFLDEIAELPETMQVKLLRVLQEKTFVRVGGVKQLQTNARLIAATNKDLRKEMAYHRFREDLFYRLNVFEIYIPPLRERKEDVLQLTENFLSDFSRQYGVKKQLTEQSVEKLLAHDFPGNIRELKNVLERAFVLTEGQLIPPELISLGTGAGAIHERFSDLLPPLPVDLDSVMADIERFYLKEALRVADNKRQKAAELLGVNERSLRYRLEKADLTGGKND